MVSRWARYLAVLASCLALASCAAPVEPGAPVSDQVVDPPVSRPVVAPEPDPLAVEHVIDAAGLPSLLPAGRSWRIAGEPAFDRALARIVGRNGSAVPIATSPDLVGFRVRTYADGSPTDTSTFWYSLAQRRRIQNSELHPSGAVSFTASGEPMVEQVWDGGLVPRRVDGALLSELGRRARLAALLPLNPARPPEVDCRAMRCVALTFDDGPSEHTYQLLQVLADHGARATFFILGANIPGREDVLAATSAAGHQIGNHTESHPALSKQSRATIEAEIAAGAARLAGTPSNGGAVFRPPYGDRDARVDEVAAALGYRTVLWDVDPIDYRATDPAVIASRVLADVRPGVVVLSHDTLPATVAAYRIIVPELRRAGYELVTVDQLR